MAWRLLATSFRLAASIPQLPLGHELDLARSAGLFTKKGQKYALAAASWRKFGVDEKHAREKAFVKDENYKFWIDEDSAAYFEAEAGADVEQELLNTGGCKRSERIPRIIRFRRPEWFVAISRFLLPFEHFLLPRPFEEWGLPAGGPSGRVIGKGLSHRTRADLLLAKWNHYDSPVAFCIDGSKWDRQVNEWQLLASMVVMLAAFDDWRAEFSWMLFRQMITMGVVYVDGYRIDYELFGSRASGDINTGAGNCLIFFIILVTAMISPDWQSWRVGFDFAVDGDDCIVLCEQRDLPLVSRLITTTFFEAGHNVTVEGVALEFEDITWCQCHPVLVADAWIMVRDPRAAIGKALVSPKYAASDKAAASHLYAVAMGEAIIGQGVPMVQAWARHAMEAALAAGATPFSLRPDDSSTYRRLLTYLEEAEIFDILPPQGAAAVEWRDFRAIHWSIVEQYPALPISAETRASFARAFGISEAMQGAFEAQPLEYDFAIDPSGFIDRQFHYDSGVQCAD
jgi:hypothetical protein